MKNELSQPVRFTQLRQSCACMGATRMAKMELAPGEETVLHFDVDLRHRKGRQVVVCRLVEAGGSEWSYTVETTIYRRARFEENGGTHFGMVDPLAEAERDTTFLLHAEKVESLPRQVKFRTNSTRLRIEAGEGEAQSLSDGTAIRRVPLKLRLRAPQTARLGQGVVTAEVVQNGVKQAEHTVVTWNVRSCYSVEPPQAFFGSVDPSATKPLERVVTVRRKDGKALKISGASGSSTALRWGVEATDNPSVWRVVLSLDPKTMTGPVWCEVKLETGDPAQPWVQIPVAALLPRSG